MKTPAAPRRTASLLVVFSGLQMVLFPIPIITLFWKDQLGMSLADGMLLQSIFSVASVLLEFPSGYIADRLGHRASLVTASVLWIAGWIAYLFASTFMGAVAAETLLGAGMAFASGADSALLFTALQAGGRTAEYSRWEGWTRASSQGGEAASSAVGGFLYGLNARLPFAFQIPAAAAALITTAFMCSPSERAPKQHSSHFGEAWNIVKYTLSHRRLRASIGLSATLGMSTFVMVWFIQPYMQNRGIATPWLGPLWAIAHAYLAFVSLTSARATRKFGKSTVLLGCCVLIAIGYAGLAAGSSPAAAMFYLCLMTVRGLQGPILVTAMQNDAPAESRASVLSLNALVFRLSFIAIGTPIGALADRIGLEPSLKWLGLGFTVLSLAAFAEFRRAHRHAED